MKTAPSIPYRRAAIISATCRRLRRNSCTSPSAQGWRQAMHKSLWYIHNVSRETILTFL
ncbi:hypothetical protein ACVIW2_008425 [Bradyrhizobium huanghuaihaiense]